MVEKRYQVFLSSTYADLREERQQVLHAILDAGCIPVGMESFPANDNDAWKFIEAVIRDCDYYVLVMAGKYGSEAKDGKSYTQKEYEYAKSLGIPVLAFPFRDIGELKGHNLETDETRRAKLAEFRKQVQDSHIVKLWETADGLKHAVLQALNHAQRTTPREGSIRARYAMNADSLNELEQLRKRVSELDKSEDLARQTYAADDDEMTFEVGYTVNGIAQWFSSHDEPPPSSVDDATGEYEYPCSWSEILSVIGPKAMSPVNQDILNFLLEVHLHELIANDMEVPKDALLITIPPEQIESVAIQLAAIGYFQPVQMSGGPHWELTASGRRKIYAERAMKKKKSASEDSAAE